MRRLASFLVLAGCSAAPPSTPTRTVVTIVGDAVCVNGRPVNAGTAVEGLLLNSRMVQGCFDDLNPETAKRWAYPDTGTWDPERNVREFLAAMPEWRRRGLNAFTINFQGGSPEGYSQKQPWENSAFEADGAHSHDICQLLGARGVCLRGGHHCAQPLMERFGIVATTRASLAPYNDEADVDAMLAGLDEALALLR